MDSVISIFCHGMTANVRIAFCVVTGLALVGSSSVCRISVMIHLPLTRGRDCFLAAASSRE